MKQKHYLVDCSYICYFSGFSAFKQYKYNFDIPKYQCTPDFDPTIDPEFCEIFKNTLEYSIIRPLQLQLPFIDKSKFIFCMDCARKNIWRRDIYPEYKLSRDLKDNSKDEFNISSIFQYAYNVLLPRIM